MQSKRDGNCDGPGHTYMLIFGGVISFAPSVLSLVTNYLQDERELVGEYR